MDIPSKTAESNEYQILSSHLSDSIGLETAVSDLARSLVQTVEKSGSDEQVSECLSQTWNSFLLHASQISYDSPKQGALAQLLLKLSQESSLEVPSTKEPIEVSGAKVWTDLPLFGQQVRECWNFPMHEEVKAETKKAWINVNAFVARLTALSFADGKKALDFSLYGIWAMRSGLEEELKEGSTADAMVGAATVWIVYSGAALRELSQEHKEFQGKTARSGGKVREKEWRGFAVERWQLWKEELEKLTGFVKDKEVKGLLEQALEAMKQ